MGSQHLNLKWCNHHSNLLAVFAKLLTSESFTDVTLVCENASIRAHKIILSACSPFFHDIFSQHPCQNPIIVLKDVSYTDLKILIDFIYCGEVNIAQEYLPSFLQVAESLKVKGLSDKDTPPSCSSSSKSVGPSASQRSFPARCKRFKNSSNISSDKAKDGSLNVQDKRPREENISNCSPREVPSPGTTDFCSSPAHPFEHSHNWGATTDSSKFVEVNMQDDDTLITGESECLDQDDPSDLVEIYDDNPQELKPLHLPEVAFSNVDPVSHLKNIASTASPSDIQYPESMSNANDYLDSSVGTGCYPEVGQSEEAVPAQLPVPSGHVLTKLPPHKKKDCIVCGNRQAGKRRRSRQWCPGCNVGVHVHCFEKLEHYRRTNKRTPSAKKPAVCKKTVGLELVSVKTEPFDEITIDSSVDSEEESNSQMETITSEIG